MTGTIAWMGREISTGFYRVRRVPKGPWIGCEVTIQDAMLFVVEDGAPSAHGWSLDALPDEIDEATAAGRGFTHPVLRLLLWGERIEEGEYRLLISTSAWARTNSPQSPQANPDKSVDTNSIPVEDLF
jgi:hypothetical protein